MAKTYVDEEGIERVEIDKVDIEVVEKKSLLTKAKEKVSAIGDMTIRDVGKGVLKVGAAVGGVALIAVGAVKLLGSDDDDYDVMIVTDDDGNEMEVISDDKVEE